MSALDFELSSPVAAREQLAAYFAGELRTFSLPLAPRGSPFQTQVWRALAEIPFGETRSYGQLAASLGHPGAGPSAPRIARTRSASSCRATA